jgi:hypothetical protein
MDEWNKNRTLHPDAAHWEREEADDNGKRHRDQEAQRKKKLDDALDKALEESFPGSDPVSITPPPAKPPRGKAER